MASFNQAIVGSLQCHSEQLPASSLSSALQNLLLKAGIHTQVTENERQAPKTKGNTQFKTFQSNHLDLDLDRSSFDLVLNRDLSTGTNFISSIGIVDGFVHFERDVNHPDSEAKRLELLQVNHSDRQYYENCVKCLSLMFKHSEDLLADIDKEKFAHKYHQYFLWTNNSHLFHEVNELLAEKNSSCDLLALLILCSGLERSLGNLYLLKGSQVPGMIKDLLVTTELHQILGFVPLQILQIVIGPPISMNIRNITWHGFLADGELPRRYIYFLLLMTASLGKLLEVRGVVIPSIPCRDYVSLKGVDTIAAHFSELTDEDFQCAERLISNSWIVDNSNRSFFRMAFHLLKQKKYGRCSVLLFPLLEHALRKLFVAVNNCPPRLITAETTTLFTTFDEILESNLPDGQENGLIHVLSEPCMDLLHDLMVYPPGPRCRDKLSHGEADHTQVPSSLPNILLILLVWLAGEGLEEKEFRGKLENYMSSYSSVFHPVALLRHKVLELGEKRHELQAKITLSPTLEPWTEAAGTDVFIENNPTLSKIADALSQLVAAMNVRVPKELKMQWEHLKNSFSIPFLDNGDDIKSVLRSFKIRTLFRWKRDGARRVPEGVTSATAASETPQGKAKQPASSAKVTVSHVAESEVVGLLTRTTEEAITSVNQTAEALKLRCTQLAEKKLRSRQRDNLKRLLLFAPTAGLLSNYVVCLCVWLLVNLDGYAGLDQTQCRALQKQLKSALQAMENIRTYTAPDQNRWSEAGDLLLAEVNAAHDRCIKGSYFKNS